MTQIKLCCRGATAWAEVEGDLTAGAVGIPVQIECDSAWDGLVRTLVCMSAEKKIPVVLGGETPVVAWEALTEGLHLYLGLEGRDGAGNEIIPTTWADCGVVQPSTEQSHTASPTPTEIEQLLTLAGTAGEDSRRALALCRTLSENLVSQEDIRAAVNLWMESHPGAGAALDETEVQGIVTGVLETWLAEHPEITAVYDDTDLRQQLRQLDTDGVQPLSRAVDSALEEMAHVEERVLQAVDGKLDAAQSALDAGKVLAIGPDGMVAPMENAALLTLPEGLVVAEEDEMADEDSAAVEALLLNNLTLESDGEYLCLMFGSHVLGRAEAGSGSGTVRCTGLTFAEERLTLDMEAEAYSLAVTISPADCTQTLRWISSDPAVVTVDGDGVVTVVGEGSTVITARCGNVSAAIDVTVVNSYITGWHIHAGNSLNAGSGSWQRYSQGTRGNAYYLDNYDAPIPITGGKTYRVEWDDISETDPSVAKICLNLLTYSGTARLTASGWKGANERSYTFTAGAAADGLSFNVLLNSAADNAELTVAPYEAWLEEHIRIKEVG